MNQNGGGEIAGYKVISVNDITKHDWDEIIVLSVSAHRVIRNQLQEMGIDNNKINTSYVEFFVRARETFLKNYSEIVKHNNLQGDVAEVGVFQGEFAKLINEFFGDRKLCLFDTFSGFDQRDIDIERENKYSEAQAGNLGQTSVELVLSKMKNRNRVNVYEGYFPETAVGLSDTFVFVSMDLDLYQPTYEGLKLFWPLMVPNGVILVHDYFDKGYQGIKIAVDRFCEDNMITPFPIGDDVSVALIKNKRGR